MSEWMCNFTKLVYLLEPWFPHLCNKVHLFIPQTSAEHFPSAGNWPGSWGYNGEENRVLPSGVLGPLASHCSRINLKAESTVSLRDNNQSPWNPEAKETYSTGWVKLYLEV